MHCSLPSGLSFGCQYALVHLLFVRRISIWGLLILQIFLGTRVFYHVFILRVVRQYLNKNMLHVDASVLKLHPNKVIVQTSMVSIEKSSSAASILIDFRLAILPLRLASTSRSACLCHSVSAISAIPRYAPVTVAYSSGSGY
ncbi:hypothetical protein BU23DRAFT_25359 [Bimuria novae-zelandiae CBS 107.79]|uniref:Uncharacterized protein n=1 Tax=Bimuria novae-zelandiae CBS 107.79 TaxID=1447943 RepID=A0A6A5UL18_9PLEO|nr:hypothetical protein BU23DRAFT_25359 [Bimuria novae-zelandiae CBS 107.79]